MADIDTIRDDVIALKGKSNFQVNPLNALGLEREEARDILYQYARRKPVEYSAWRLKTIKDVIHEQARKNYEFLFNFLAKGFLDGETKKNQLKVDNVVWSPAIPEQEAGEVAADFAASTVKLMREQLNKIMPPDFETLANSKVKILTSVADGATL